MNENKPVDLSALDVIAAANKGAAIEIVHPTLGTPVGLYIRVVGKDSDAFRAVTIMQNRRRLDKMTKTGTLKVNAVSHAEIEADGTDALATATLGFYEDKECTRPATILLDKDKPAVGYSHSNCILVYTRMPWIKEQVDAGIADRAGFLEQ